MRSLPITSIFLTALVFMAVGIDFVLANSAPHGQLSRRHGGVSRNALQGRSEDVGHNETSIAKRGFTNAKFSYYYVEQGPVACNSNRYQSSDHVVALNIPQWDGGSNCGKRVSISWQGKTVEATIVDQCVICPYAGLDLTTSLFVFFDGTLDPGYLYQGSWEFIGEDGDQGQSQTTSSATSKTEAAQKTSHSSSVQTNTVSSSASTAKPASSSSSFSGHSFSTSAAGNGTATATSDDTNSQASATPSPTAALDSIDQWMLAYVQLAALIASSGGSS